MDGLGPRIAVPRVVRVGGAAVVETRACKEEAELGGFRAEGEGVCSDDAVEGGCLSDESVVEAEEAALLVLGELFED